ncbi:uncharacterized protein LOC129948362 [Eupeodes corollae]|uniref:uncharacterized protein LOC129948362 n=1 Tax=Eupeodes corollae TaxID=290404 RepID=UPI0024925298|nr:uncharacterized protein LOC129948362 [Eupeodes corollae]
MRYCKILFFLRISSKNDPELREVFDFCWLNGMVNVIAVLKTFSSSSTFYSFTNFGVFKIEETIWKSRELFSMFYPNRMQNLNGTTLPVVFGENGNFLILFKNQEYENEIGGEHYNFFASLATTHSAILNNSNIKLSLSKDNVLKLIMNKTEEISAVNTFIQFPIESFSYPYVSQDLGIMLPIEPKIPKFKVFTRVIHWDVALILVAIVVILSAALEAPKCLSGQRRPVFLNFLFNLNCFRGILGQSFTERPSSSCSHKIIYLLIFLLGIMLVTSYDAFLQALMTEPPRETFIESLQDLSRKNLKIYVRSTDVDYIHTYNPELKEAYSEIFLIANNTETFERERDAFNTKYAFTVSPMAWEKYLHLQHSRQLFRLSKEIRLVPKIPWAFPVSENSIFKGIINFHIMKVYSAGLNEYWRRQTFQQLLESGRIQLLKYFESKPRLNAIKAKDLKWIWIGIGVAFVVCFLCFIAELFVFKLKKCDTLWTTELDLLKQLHRLTTTMLPLFDLSGIVSCAGHVVVVIQEDYPPRTRAIGWGSRPPGVDCN